MDNGLDGVASNSTAPASADAVSEEEALLEAVVLFQILNDPMQKEMDEDLNESLELDV